MSNISKIAFLITTEKLKKGQEILGGWEQYYHEERKPDSMIEYVIVLSMLRNKDPEIRGKVEQQRFQLINYYKDITGYMAEYWMQEKNQRNAVREYEQFFQVPEDERVKSSHQDKLQDELLRCYALLLIQPSEEVYTDILQLYTDLGEYRKASCFWDLRARYLQD